MKNQVKVTQRNNGNIKITPNIRALVKSACKATLDFEKFTDSCEVNVTFVDDKKIAKMNKQFRDLDKPTDVLSFPLGENGIYDQNPESGALMLGDIVISTERATTQALEYGHSFEREIAFLTVHSMLHLLGYDHMVEDEEKEMFKKQEEVLKQMNLTR